MHPRLTLLAGRREAGIVLALALVVLAILLAGERVRGSFLQPYSLQTLLRQVALLSVFAIGETLVIISGGIDLSVGSVIAFSGVLFAVLTASGLDPTAAVAVTLAAGALLGLVHAALIAGVGLPPFVATLGSMSAMRGCALLLTGSVPITIADERFNFLGNGMIAGLPVPLYVALGLAALCSLVLARTRHGRYLYAVGGNEEALRLSGVSVFRVKALAYVGCAACAALAGLLYAAYNRQGNPSSGLAYELHAIAAAVIGGASLSGGGGTVVGTLLGAALFHLILKGLNLVILKNASLWEGVVLGLVLVLAVSLSTARRGRQAA